MVYQTNRLGWGADHMLSPSHSDITFYLKKKKKSHSMQYNPANEKKIKCNHLLINTMHHNLNTD